MSDSSQRPLDYGEIYPKVLRRLFPDSNDRKEAEKILSAYGTRSFHSEIQRVRTAILKVAGSNLEALSNQTETACCDYRDALCDAEYSNQSKSWGLRKRDPKKYQRIKEKDLKEHLEWIDEVTGSR